MKGPLQLFGAATVKQGDYSPMATQENLNRVQELYVAYYGRPADQEGQEYWAERLEAEGESAIINAFGTSEEYTALSAGKGNATLVNSIYMQAFGRNADPEGLDYYSGVLARGEKTLAEIALTITNAAGGIDAQTFNARVDAAAEYTTNFGAAGDYNLEAAKAAVANAEVGIYIPQVTEAIENLTSANAALNEFLASDAVDFDDDPDTVTTAAEVRANLTTAQGELETHVTNNGSVNQLNSDLQDAQAQVTAANNAIAQVSGLRAAINTLMTAEAAQAEASEAATAANAELDGEVVTFNALNTGDVTVNADGTATYTVGANAPVDLFTLNANGELVVNQQYVTANQLKGVDALLADTKASVSADKALNQANTAVTDADDRVTALGGEDELTALETAQDAVTAAEAEIATRAELQADVTEAQALVTQLTNLETGVSDAETALSDLNIDLNDQDNGVLNDLYLYDAENGISGPVTTFGADGQDLIYIGDTYSRVNLEETADLSTASFGQSGTLEVFFQQNGANVDVFFETEAFQGNATNGFEGDTITLTGVTVDELQLENGYISIA